MTAALMHRMGYRLGETASEPAPAAPTPTGVLPPIPLSDVGPDGLPVGLGMTPAGG